MRDCNRGQARAEIDSGWLERDLARETRRLEVRQPLGSRVGGVLGVRSAVRQGVACSRGLITTISLGKTKNCIPLVAL